MSYQTNIGKNHQEITHLVHFCRRIEIVETWTEVDAGLLLYSIDWDKGPINLLRVQVGTVLNRPYRGSNSLAELYETEFSYFVDTKENKLYARIGAGFAPPVQIFVEVLSFAASSSLGFHLYPNDSDSQIVNYPGNLTSDPTITYSAIQSVFGYLPAQQSNITIANNDGIYDVLIEGSLSNTEFRIYRIVGDIHPENAALVFRGYLRSANFTEDSVSLSYVDASSLLDNEVANAKFSSTYEPNLVGAIQRRYYSGRLNRQIAVCKNYSDTISTATNREWEFGENFADNQKVLTTDNAMVGSNTTTRTYLDSTDFLEVDNFIIRSGTLAVAQITAVTANYIDHTTVTALGSSDTFIKSQLQNIFIIEKSTGTALAVEADSVASITSKAITFNTSLDTNLGLTPSLNTTDYMVVATVDTYMAFNFLDTGSPLSLNSLINDTAVNPAQVIYEFLYEAGFYDDPEYYDAQSFIDVSLATSIDVNVATPRNFNSFSPETYRQVIAKICETAFIKLYMKNGVWKLAQVKPIGADPVTVTIDENNALFGLAYRVESEDLLKKVTLRYDFRELNNNNVLSQDGYRTKSGTNSLAEAVNNNNKNRVIDTYISEDASSDGVLDNFLFYFSRPLAYLKLTLSLSEMEIDLSDVVLVTEQDNYPFSGDKLFSVVSITERGDKVEVELFDQAGVEENSGDWFY